LNTFSLKIPKIFKLWGGGCWEIVIFLVVDLENFQEISSNFPTKLPRKSEFRFQERTQTFHISH
jgi:hypothetical protein